MKNKAVRLAGSLGLLAVLIGSLTGCGQRVTQTQPQTETQTVVQVTRQTETETQTSLPETETETETESETQKLITSVDYTSKDGSVKITLPDNTWKVTQDADEMRVFQSGNAAIINIVHTTTETATRNLNVMTTEEDLRASLTSQYTSEDAYEIEDFTTTTISGVNIYRYTVKYNAAARMWAYSTTNAIIAADQAYVVTGTVTDDNETLLQSVKTAVESFRVLSDETLKNVTGEVISGTEQTETQTDTAQTEAGSAGELSSLSTYASPTTLTTNDEVNVRANPGTDSDIIDALTTGQSVTVTGETSGWYQVSVNGVTGYVRKDFLTDSANASQSTSTTSTSSADSSELSTANNYGTNVTLYASSTVNLRSQPGTDSDILGSVAAGSAVTVTGETSNWFIVNVGGTTGYISKAYLTYSNTAGSTSTGTSSSTTGTTTTTTDNTATASTDSTTTDNSGTTTTDNSGTTTTTTTSTISGTVTGTTADTITVQGDDGNTYTVNYDNASVTTTDGLYDGVYVNVGVTGTNADGTLSASSVTGS